MVEIMAEKGKIPEKILLSLGANIGPVERNFRIAVDKLQKQGLESTKLSSLYRTKAVGCAPGTPDFINAALSGIWTNSVEALHSACRKIEIEAGRPAEHPKWSSRTLDIDIVFFGPLVISSPELDIPHKDALKRLFVLVPASEIEPDIIVPGTGFSISDHLKRNFTPEEVEKMMLGKAVEELQGISPDDKI